MGHAPEPSRDSDPSESRRELLFLPIVTCRGQN